MNQPDVLTTLPPFNDIAERVILGAILRDNSAMAIAESSLEPGSFYQDVNVKIFGAMIELFHDRRPIDVIGITEILQREWLHTHPNAKPGDETSDLIRLDYLEDLWNDVPTAAHIQNAIAVVSEKSKFRQMIHVGNQLLRDAYSPVGPPEELISRTQSDLLRIDSGSRQTGVISITDVIDSITREIDRNTTSEKPSRGIPTEIHGLDDMLGGLKKEHLIIVAARTSHGKSAFAGTVARNIATAGHGVYWVSLEMSGEEIGYRLLSGQSRVSNKVLQSICKTSPLKDDEKANVLDASIKLRKLPIWFNDSSNQRFRDIRSSCRYVISQHKIGLVIVDHLHLLPDREKKNSLREKVGELAREMKLLAGDLKLPVMCLAQLNRGSAKENRPPALHDLQEAGDIEQSANTVVLLNRLGEIDKESGKSSIDYRLPHRVDANIAKQRGGPTGIVPLTFHPSTVTFTDAIPEGIDD